MDIRLETWPRCLHDFLLFKGENIPAKDDVVRKTVEQINREIFSH